MIDIYVQSTATATPFEEGFEGPAFLPNGWTLNNPDNDETWVEISVIGSGGTNSDVARVDNFTYNAAGEEDYFETEVFYIDGGMATMSFDLAKVQYSTTYQDSLAVLISDDCGVSWSTIYAKGGDDLETSSTSTNNWSPTLASHWRKEEVDISAYLGENVSFRFVNITGYGNSTYIDNINVTSDLSIGENDQVHFSIFPNPTGGNATLSVSNQLDNNSRVVITNQVGQTVKVIDADAFLNNKVAIDLTPYQRGVYFVTVYTIDLNTTKRIVKN